MSPNVAPPLLTSADELANARVVQVVRLLLGESLDTCRG